MPLSDGLESLKAHLSDLGNFVEVQTGSNGLLPARCVDKRLVDQFGGSVRLPGNSIGLLAMLLVAGEIDTLSGGVPTLATRGLRPGGHTNTCAFDHNLATIAGLVAEGDDQLNQVLGYSADAAGIEVDTRQLAGKFEQVMPEFKRHTPDSLVSQIGQQLGDRASIVDPPEQALPAAAYVMDLSPDGLVLRQNPELDTGIYMDTTADAMQQSGNEQLLEVALAFSAATALVVARAHRLPIVQMSGKGDNTVFTTFLQDEQGLFVPQS